MDHRSDEFLDDTVERIYGDLRRDFELFTVFAGVAIPSRRLRSMGLAAHGTREISIRKVPGSSRAGIMGLVMWQFSLPVLLANLMAWPAAYLAMSSWLGGPARRIELQPWMFIAAALASLALADIRVAAHAWSIAGVRPVVALQQELRASLYFLSRAG